MMARKMKNGVYLATGALQITQHIMGPFVFRGPTDTGNFGSTIDHKDKIQDIKYNGYYKQEILS